LNGLTLSPGFYDAHSHFSLNAAKMTQGFDLSSPPIGKVTKIADIIKNVKKYITDFNIPAGSTVSGMGYNDISLEDKRLITK
jgi:predicted amidohydrolase YtcJ